MEPFSYIFKKINNEANKWTQKQQESQVLLKLKNALRTKDYPKFCDAIVLGKTIGYPWQDTIYQGRDQKQMTILEMAIEQDDEEPYGFVWELLAAGARADFLNPKTGNAPIHAAAKRGIPQIFTLLFKFGSKVSHEDDQGINAFGVRLNNKADVNVTDRDGLTAFHILLTRLVELGNPEYREKEQKKNGKLLVADKALPKGKEENEGLEEEIMNDICNVLHCMIIMLTQQQFRGDLVSRPVNMLKRKFSNVKNHLTLKELCTKTPLQIICSFQNKNAKPPTKKLNSLLKTLVSKLLAQKKIDPNATGLEPEGSLAPVLLAAERGYCEVIRVFKTYRNTDFLVENKFNQTILHIILKCGYHSKIAMYGKESAEGHIQAFLCLFEDGSKVQLQMRSIVNLRDMHKYTALHYTKPYPDQLVAKTLLDNGAKIFDNPQGGFNVNVKTLKDQLTQYCVTKEGGDIDDENFWIRINFKFFEKSEFSQYTKLADVKRFLQDTPSLSSHKVDVMRTDETDSATEKLIPGKNKSQTSKYKSALVDTNCLKQISNMDSHKLLDHPLVASFLEIELSLLKVRYIIEFLVYFFFVAAIIFFHMDRYDLSSRIEPGTRPNAILFQDLGNDFIITRSFILLCVMLVFQVMVEVGQMFRLRSRYIIYLENLSEWVIIMLVVLSMLPRKYISQDDEQKSHRHIVALTLLLAFIRLYYLLSRMFHNTKIPLYINMYTTVLKTYTFILLCYVVFIVSFSYSFFLIFHPYTRRVLDGKGKTYNVTREDDKNYADFGLSLVKTIVTFAGEINYSDLKPDHWLGYAILVLYIFLVMIVLMNVLNGLAVSDINRIRAKVDTYYYVSIVKSLVDSTTVDLLADEIVLRPNARPENLKIWKVPIPGYKVYYAKGGQLKEEIKNTKTEQNNTTYDDMIKERYYQTKYFAIKEDTVKAAKELVSLSQEEDTERNNVNNARKIVMDALMEVKEDQVTLRESVNKKLEDLEQNIMKELKKITEKEMGLTRRLSMTQTKVTKKQVINK